jgi:hypothetical protein
MTTPVHINAISRADLKLEGYTLMLTHTDNLSQ